MSKFGEGKANGKEKSSFFSAFGKKKKADKPQYDGDMKHGKANGKANEPAEDSSGDEEAQPRTNEEMNKAEEEMEAELEKLVGMETVKVSMRKLCKQLSLDIRRRQQGHAVLDSIRHMMFTGNPGVGKTTVSRLVAKLYKQLGVSSKDHVIEVQKGDLVAGYVNDGDEDGEEDQGGARRHPLRRRGVPADAGAAARPVRLLGRGD